MGPVRGAPDTTSTISTSREIGLQSDFCNRRGVSNECIMDEQNFFTSTTFDITEDFISLHNATIDADGTSFNMSGRTEISGFWKGSMNIVAKNPVLTTGAVFRPSGTIKIGK